MTFSDTSSETVGRLFFSQVRDMTLGTARAVGTARKKSYKSELGRILEDYAPEASKIYRHRFAIYR